MLRLPRRLPRRGDFKKVLRRSRAFVARHLLPTETFEPQEIGRFFFGQLQWSTAKFFMKHLGHHHFRLTELPFYRFLKREQWGDWTESLYFQYLRETWFPCKKRLSRQEEERRSRKIQRMFELWQRIRAGEKIREPITVVRREDGEVVVIHGNHRASISLSLGIPIRARFLNMKKVLFKTVHVPWLFYGTWDNRAPYQSIFLNGRELLRGRRRDIYDRMKMIEADIRGSSVLDLGCNTGANGMIAQEMGATKAIGVEVQPHIATGALKLGVLLGKDKCYVHVGDIGEPLPLDEQFDVVLCLSLWAHIDDRETAVKNIMGVTKRLLVFEGHANTSMRHYDELLNRSNFSHIELLGYTEDGTTRAKNRPLFRCEVR